MKTEGHVFTQTSLLSAMLGACIGFAIQGAIEHSSPWTWVALVALILHVANFFHGKLIALYDVNLRIKNDARPLLRALTLPFNATIFLVFGAMAIRIHDVWFIIVGEVILRIVDSAGVLAEMRFLDRSPGAKGHPERRHLAYWLQFNVISGSVFAAIGLLGVSGHASSLDLYAISVMALAILVFIDLILEYSVYSESYYSSAGNWRQLAERWDRLQGQMGDFYRRAVIHPHLGKLLRGHDIGQVIDLGCGNGATLRYLREAGLGSAFTGLDLVPEFVEFGRMYEIGAKPEIHYICQDICESKGVAAAVDGSRSGNRLLLSLFAFQDCDSLPLAFEAAAGIMAPGDSLIIVYESEESFMVEETHASTVRTWKYSLGAGQKKQMVSWLPVESTEESSLFYSSGSDSGEIISVPTNYRTRSDYRIAARAVGLSEVNSGTIMEAYGGSADQIRISRYKASPKFSWSAFEVIIGSRGADQ